MPPAHVRHFSAAATDRGSVRPENEDRVYCDDLRGFFLVVDGIGGHEAGEQAAEIALEKIHTRLERQTDTIEQRLREAIVLANNAIFDRAQEKPEWRGMSCVLTVAVVDNGRVTVGQVGDSRLYKLKRGVIEKITRDHSPVGEREDNGELTEAEAMRHPRRNEVYRDVGSEEHRPDDDGFIDIFTFEFEPDAALLLCSDGLSDAIPSRRILEIVERNAGDRWGTVRALIGAATEVGNDNVSAVLVEGENFAASFGKHAVDRRELGDITPCLCCRGDGATAGCCHCRRCSAPPALLPKRAGLPAVRRIVRRRAGLFGSRIPDAKDSGETAEGARRQRLRAPYLLHSREPARATPFMSAPANTPKPSS